MELLLVVTIMILMASFAVPAFSSIMTGQNITRAGQMVADRIAFARQEAVSKNRDTEVRFFFKTNMGRLECRAIQIWRVDDTVDGAVETPISRLAELPETVVIATNATLSPLIASAPITNTVDLGERGVFQYRAFRIRANGLTESAVVNGANFLTLHSLTDTNNTPVNYFTIQIHPLTGKVVVYRP